MANYDELKTAMEDAALQTRMRVACLVAAETIRGEAAGITNHANRMLWAKATFNDPVAAASAMIRTVVIQNRALTLSQIVGASDSAMQTAVNAAVDVFATGS